MPVTIKDAMRLEPFQRCQLVAGQGGIDNIILYADSMEVPDIAPWLSRNLLLITTGYSIKNDPESVVSLIADLHRAGSAGLAIKTKFIGSICPEAIALADRLSLPLIQIPDDMPFITMFVPLMNAISSEQNTRLRDNNFFVDIISQAVKGEEEARFRARNLNWPAPPLGMFVLDIDRFEQLTGSKTEDELHIIKEGIMEVVSRVIGEKNVHSAVILKGDSFTVLVPGNYKRAVLIEKIKEIQSWAKERLQVTLTAGIPGEAEDYMSLRKCYDDARDAIHIARIEQRSDKIGIIEEQKLEQACLRMKDNDCLKEFVSDTIGVIEAYDRENRTELLTTLRELISCMGNKTKAAERLFLHRNTLLYRIKKIEALTGRRLSGTEELISLGIALKVKPYLG